MRTLVDQIQSSKFKIKALASIVLLLSAILLGGCAEVADAVQSRYSDPVGEIHGARTVGQTFVAHDNDLSRVDVLLATYMRKNTHPVTFRLKESPNAADDIATITISAARVKDNAFHQFKFAPIPDSKDKSYFFTVESPESVPGNAITIWHDPGDVYDEGAMYVNGQATGGDLAFRTYYGGLEDVVSGLRSGIGRSISLLVLTTLLFTLPGHALLLLLSPGDEFDFTQRLILSAGLSVALFPLLLYFGSNLGIRLDGAKVAGLLVVCGGISCWGIYRALRRSQTATERRSPELVRVIPATASACGREDPQQVGDSHQRPRPERAKPYGLKPSPAGVVLSLSKEALSSQHGGLAPCLLAFIFALSLAVRLLMIRGMPYPAWSDSYHHTIISQMIAEGGIVPESYRPYIAVDTFAYHFGFHSVVAFFHWITGMDVPQAVLVVGQILNALSVLSIYLLAHYLTKDRWAALASALIVGLLSVMPAYYVNWGRYPQLCGQVILPVAAVLTVKCLKTKDVIASFPWRISPSVGDRNVSPSPCPLPARERGRAPSPRWGEGGGEGKFLGSVVKQSPASNCTQRWRLLRRSAPRNDNSRNLTLSSYTRLFLATLATAGLFLAHYRVSLFYVLFVVLYLFGESWLSRREPRKVVNLGGRFFLVGLLSLIILAPWLKLLISDFTARVQQAQAQGFQLDPTYNLVTWDIIISMGLRPVLLAMAALGAAWGLWRRDKYAILVAVWTLSLFILANPHVLGLPGTGLVNNGTVVMALYIPGSILAGFFVAYLRLPKSERWFSYGLAVAVILVSLWGAANTLQLLTPETFFVTPSDLKAMAWIRDNIPEDARFAINTQFWLSYAAIGTDAGYWIPFLTGRETTLPPMLYSEGTYEYVDEVNALARATAGLCESDVTLPILRENGVTHVYIGQRGGCLRPQRLLASPNYEAVYHQDGVWVFEVRG